MDGLIGFGNEMPQKGSGGPSSGIRGITKRELNMIENVANKPAVPVFNNEQFKKDIPPINNVGMLSEEDELFFMNNFKNVDVSLIRDMMNKEFKGCAYDMLSLLQQVEKNIGEYADIVYIKENRGNLEKSTKRVKLEFS